MQKINNFNYYYKKALNDDNFKEIFMEGLMSGLGNALKVGANIAGSAASAAGNAATSFQSGFKKGMKGEFIDPKKVDPKGDKIGFKNRPKKNDIIVSDGGGIRAKVISDDIGSDGQWDIELFKNSDPIKQLSYFETTNPTYMDGVITTRDHLLINHYDQGKNPSQQSSTATAAPTAAPTPVATAAATPVAIEPPDGTISNNINKKGIKNKYIYLAKIKKWQNTTTNKYLNPNASAAKTLSWQKKQAQQQQQQQQQPQTQNQPKKNYTITYGSDKDYPVLKTRVGFNTIYPTWYREKDQLKNF